MSLIPVYFSFPDTSIIDTNRSYPFEFSPSTRTILLAKPHDISDPAANGNNFVILNITDDFKIHI